MCCAQVLLLPSLSLADSYGAPQAAPYNSYDSYSGRRGTHLFFRDHFEG